MATKKSLPPKQATPTAKVPSKAVVEAPEPAPQKPKEQLKLSKAKGRPMLNWVGKRPLRSVTAFPAQHIESFTALDASKLLPPNPDVWKDWPASYPQGGLLFHGDNKEVLAHLLPMVSEGL